MSKVPEFLPAEEANKYGFIWPDYELDDPGNAPQVQVTRLASVNRGKRGVYRTLNVLTKRQQINVYISPTGMIRVFDGEGGEFKRDKQG